MHENDEEFISLTRRIRNFKETIKIARNELETPVAPARPYKMSKNSQNWVTRGKSNDFQSKCACILEASESARMRMGESLPNHHEDHIAGKGNNSLQHYNLVHKFIPKPQAMKIPAAKAAVDIVKDDSGSYAVFTEQGSSASQMTAAKVMDIISRLLGCAGQAADAVSAYTRVKMEDAHELLKISKSECPHIWIRLPRHKWPKSWSSMEDPVVPLERNLYGHPLAGLLWERQFEKILLKDGWEKVSKWECLFVHREKGLFLSVYVDDIKVAGKKQNINPMWKGLNREVDLGEKQHHSLIM